MFTGPVPAAASLETETVPRLIVSPPEKVLVPVNVNVPVPTFTRPSAPVAPFTMFPLYDVVVLSPPTVSVTALAVLSFTVPPVPAREPMVKFAVVENVPLFTVRAPPSVPPPTIRLPAPVLVIDPAPEPLLRTPRVRVPVPVPLLATLNVVAPFRVAAPSVKPNAWLAGVLASGTTFSVDPAAAVSAPMETVGETAVAT